MHITSPAGWLAFGGMWALIGLQGFRIRQLGHRARLLREQRNSLSTFLEKLNERRENSV